MLFKAFEVLENTHNIGTRIQSFKEYLGIDIRSDEEFYVSVVSTFVTRVTSITNETSRKKYFPSNFRIK